MAGGGLRVEWWEVALFILLGEAIGFFSFIVFTPVRWRAHIGRSLATALRFYLWPFPPRRMIRILHLDGEEAIYYDNMCEVEEEKGASRVTCRDGRIYVVSGSLGEAAAYRRFYDLRAGEDVPSPISPLWRWIVSRTFALYFGYYVPFALALGSPIASYLGYIVVVAFMLFIVHLTRFAARETLYFAGVVTGVRGHEHYVSPLPGETRIPVVDFLKTLGRIVVVQVPKEVRQVFDELKEKVKSDVLAASQLAAIARKRTLMDTVATVLEDDLRLVKAGESYAMIRARPFSAPRFRLSSLAAGLIIGLIIGGALGYIFGSTWAVSPSPPAAQAAYKPAQPPAPPQQAPVGPTYTPAQPPGVPANSTASPPYSPAPAPAPPRGG